MNALQIAFTTLGVCALPIIVHLGTTDSSVTAQINGLFTQSGYLSVFIDPYAADLNSFFLLAHEVVLFQNRLNVGLPLPP